MAYKHANIIVTCSQCGKWFYTNRERHNKRAVCPVCLAYNEAAKGKVNYELLEARQEAYHMSRALRHGGKQSTTRSAKRKDIARKLAEKYLNRKEQAQRPHK